MADESSVHLTATIHKTTDDALEKHCQLEHGGRRFKIPKSQVVDDALRKYLGLEPINRKKSP
jgi:hypothetical protein